MDEATKLPIGPEEVAEAAQILQRYKAGKAALDKRLVDNELWFRMGHWKNYQNPMMEGKPQPSSGWLFNSIANKHADAALAALEMMDFEGIEKVRQRVRQNGTLAQQLAQMQAQMAQLTGLLEVQKKSEAPKLSGPAQELSTAAMARAMKTQKGEMR